MLAATPGLRAQATSATVTPLLDPSVQVPAPTLELQHYLMKRIPKLPQASSAEEWKAETQKIRRHMLDDIAFNGWPREWVEARPIFQEAGTIETGKGYRIHKLRYEIVPGFQSTALLYEPENLVGNVPAILNVNGHEPLGKAAEYKQKRCINFAKRGWLALSLEWPGFGELAQPENQHDYGAHLDLVGANALGFFYLAMKRGLDYLAGLPNVDPARLGVTGLSGGGWQTIVLSALDERVAVAVEVAGFGSLQSNLTHPVDTDEVEENPTDFTASEDYPFLVAMRAPRPTMLIHNGEDDCCFRADLVKPYIYEQIRPFFRLFGREEALIFYENRDPGTHNYQLDNRQHAYQFFAEQFHDALPATEIPSGDEVRTPGELKVGVPETNLTIAGLARKLADGISRPAIPTGDAPREAWTRTERERLSVLTRVEPVTIESAWRLWNTKHQGVETLTYRFDFSDGLSATGVWLKAIQAPDNAPATLVLNDKGKKAAGEVVADRINRGEQILALEPIFNGASVPQEPDPTDWALLVATMGKRPLGLEVSQTLAVARWLKKRAGDAPLRLETQGIRTQVVGLVAAALEPTLFRTAISGSGMYSLRYLLDKPVPLRSAPELFCLGLFKEFDLDRLAALAAPTEVVTTKYVEPAAAKAGDP